MYFCVNKKGYFWRFQVMKSRFMVFYIYKHSKISPESNQRVLYIFLTLHGHKLSIEQVHWYAL